MRDLRPRDLRSAAVIGAAAMLCVPQVAWASDMCVLALMFTLPPIWLATPMVVAAGFARTTPAVARFGVGVVLACCLVVGLIWLWSLPGFTCSGDGTEVLLWTAGSTLPFALGAAWSVRRLWAALRSP